MASFIVFELEDRDTEALQTRRFEAVGVDPDTLWRMLGPEDMCEFFDFIEEIEMELGTIDQTGERNDEGAEWTIGSCEIEDRDAFVDRVIEETRAITGWTLLERT